MIQTKIKSKDIELLPGIRMNDDGVPFVHIVAMKPEPKKVVATPEKISTHQTTHPISATVNANLAPVKKTETPIVQKAPAKSVILSSPVKALAPLPEILHSKPIEAPVKPV